MANAQALIARVSKAIQKIGPMRRTSYLRTRVHSGGDSLIGSPGSVVVTDTLLVPQPIYRQVGQRKAMFLSTPTLQLVADDYHFTFPATQVSVATFQNAKASLVLKDANGTEELQILYVTSSDFRGSALALSVFARSISHT